MNTTSSWLVTIDLDQPIDIVIDQIKATGFRIANVMKEVGCVTGKSDAKTVSALEKIPGVISVSADVEIQLPPLSSDTTW